MCKYYISFNKNPYLNLAPYIKELVSLYECIILPDIGGFETQYAPAKIDSETKQMLPPDKVLNFKPEYKIGGEILERHLQKSLYISEEEAKELVAEYVQEIKSALNTDGYFLVEEVGEFRKDISGNLNFSAIKDENYLAESFGLESIEIEASQYDAITNDIKTKVLKIRPRNNTFTFVTVGILVVVLLLALTVFISSKFNLYLFNIGSHEETNDLIIIGGNYNNDSTYTQIAQTIDEITDVKNALQFSEETSPTIEEPTTFYILVAGSFKGFNNAQEVQKKLSDEGFGAEIVEAGGYYRVSIGRFTNKSLALNELSRIRTQINRSVWLLTVNGS